MWTINSYNIFPLRTPGGDRFTEFVDALIRAEAYIQGIPLSDISTNLRTNLGDKGVDTEVRQAMPNSQTGWMNEPTCWQYKATEFRTISESDLREEVKKEYSKELIQKGYGYRFCICDDLTPTKRSEWEKILDDEITQINLTAPKSKVVTASDLAAWASQYPGIIVRFFKPDLISCFCCEDWRAEKMAAFPEFFSYAELILWKLALAETEFNIANNATNIWQQLFRIFLSGTAVPFTEKIDLLEKRLFTEKEEQINLALLGLSGAFDIRGFRILGSPLVAGRIFPEDWQPKTRLELKECFDKAVAILLKAARSHISSLQTGALNVAIQRLSTFLANGYLEPIKALFSKDTISQEILVSLIRSLEDFLRFNSDVSEEVKQWLQNLIPNDFHGRLIQIIGKSPWDYSYQNDREDRQQEINTLARQLCEDRELLKSQMQWLTSPQAIVVAELGSAMGCCDRDAVCLDMIIVT
jgi:hypothetical protein